MMADCCHYGTGQEISKMADTWKLTDEQMETIRADCSRIEYTRTHPLWWRDQNHIIALAAQKKLLEWGTEMCLDHWSWPMRRFNCPDCMQALHKELEED